MNIAIILAGGTGSRVGSMLPKQFIEVMGKPIIAYTLEKYQNNKNIDAIEIVSIESYIEYIKKMIQKYNFTKVKWITLGGSTYQQSAMNGIYNLQNKINGDDIVLIQFAVSPMITDEIIDDAIKVCRKYGNSVAADKIVMCTCIKDNDICSSNPISRESIIGFNAPWCFKYDLVLSCYKEAEKRRILDKIEPHTTSVLFALGYKIYFSKSSPINIKITYKEDLDLFEGYLLLQKFRGC